MTTSSFDSEVTVAVEEQIYDADKKEVFSCLLVQRYTENKDCRYADESRRLST